MNPESIPADGHPARLAVGIVGAGRAGTALGVALARAGHQVVAASAVSDASLRRARANFPAAVITEPSQVLRRADLALLTVPDDALPGLVAGLAATGAPLEGRMLAHASGRYGVSVLEPAVRQGALPLALHPVMTFTGRADDVDRLRGTSFGVTAPEVLRPAAEALVIEMGGEPVFIAEEHRDLYHAAIAGAANHLITLVAQAMDLLRTAGVAEPARLLAPLLSASLDNALRFGDAGLTGPVARGDAATVAAHVAALEAAAGTAAAATRPLPRRVPRRRARGGRLRGHGPADRGPRARGRDPAARRRRTPARRARRPPVSDGPQLATTRADLAAARALMPGPVVLAPTMGALHDGHARLLGAARTLAGPRGSVIVSIFVNPLQFGPNEDLDRYPRTLDADLAICAREGADLVFAPAAAEMYPGGPPEVTVDPGPAGQRFEGEFRPGFFGGVLTVVLKLLHLTRPAVAVFGQKDAQQLALVRRMVTDLNLDVVIEPVPTVRDADGLATSSRNRYLSAADRAVALALPRALRAGQAEAGGGADAVLAAARAVLRAQPALAVDYVALVDPGTFGPAGTGPALLVAAARAGTTRLIDNMALVLPAEGAGDAAHH